MSNTHDLLDNNKNWANNRVAEDANFFKRLKDIQSPHYLWIGCSDSRVPANEITGLDAGDVFVHRNVANLVIQTDLNLLSVVQYAVDVLKIKDVIVCGHYGCGGVKAALGTERFGLVDNWLRHIKNLARRRNEELESLEFEAKFDRLCELNVVAQAQNLARTTVIEDAWASGSDVKIHSWIYRLDNGLLQILADPITQESLGDE